MIDFVGCCLFSPQMRLPGSALPSSSAGPETSSGNAILLLARHKTCSSPSLGQDAICEYLPCWRIFIKISPAQKGWFSRLLLLCSRESAVVSESWEKSGGIQVAPSCGQSPLLRCSPCCTFAKQQPASPFLSLCGMARLPALGWGCQQCSAAACVLLEGEALSMGCVCSYR